MQRTGYKRPITGRACWSVV